MTDTLATKPPPTITEKPEGDSLRPRRGRNGETIVPWVLMTPTLVLLALMTIMPTIYLLRASVRNDTLLNPSGRFVGLANYINALTDAEESELRKLPAAEATVEKSGGAAAQDEARRAAAGVSMPIWA